MKYAMVAINKKEEDDGIHIRRVLISYLFKTKKIIRGQDVTFYHGTRLIDVDPYFKFKNSSHKYIFKDKYYKLNSANTDFPYAFYPSMYKKRKYRNIGKLGFEFKESNRQIAINRFRNRKELH